MRPLRPQESLVLVLVLTAVLARTFSGMSRYWGEPDAIARDLVLLALGGLIVAAVLWGMRGFSGGSDD